MKEEGKNYCDVSKLTVRKISKSVAKDIIVKNHYSHLWTKVSYAIGLYIEDDSHQFFNSSDKLIGVACYGDPIGRLSGQSITPLLDRTEVLELVRVFVFDDYGSNIESWFLGQTFQWLRTNVPQIKGLISYSDPKEGHNGTIYQATNWLYQGDKLRFNDSWSFKFSEDGEWQHGRTIFPYYGTNNKAYKVKSSPLLVTNFRMFTHMIEEGKQSTILNQNIVDDAQLAIIIDNAKPILKLPKVARNR